MQTKSIFTNRNAIHFVKWLFLKDESLKSIVFFFISGRNATSPRFLPLFNKTQNIRIVYFKGPNLPYLDRLWLKIFTWLYATSKKKIRKYEVLHLFSLRMSVGLRFEYYHFDDPTYENKEINDINLWIDFLEKRGSTGYIICTCTFIKDWLHKISAKSRALIVEQGFTSITRGTSKRNKTFSYVYTSPYIHYGTDKHGEHSAWGSTHLIDVIIPKILNSQPRAQIHLIGEIGRCALKKLSQYSRVVMHGRINQEANQKILQSCHVGLYPRKYDHKRSVQKIYEYIGANLPVVTYDLVDTEAIKINGLGFSVVSDDEFINATLTLYNNRRLCSNLSKRVEAFKPPFSWEFLAKKMEQQIKNHALAR